MFIIFVALTNLLPASLILYKILPYTGITFTCPHYKCNDISESANTITSLILDIIIALCIWITIVYDILKEVKAALLKFLLRYRYIHDRWYQGV
jgi:hypothetical protein